MRADERSEHTPSQPVQPTRPVSNRTPLKLQLQALGGGVLMILGLWIFINALTDGRPRTTSHILGIIFWGGLMLVGGGAMIGTYRTEKLSRKVLSLNPIQGKPRKAVLRRLGPAKISVREGDSEFVTWDSPGYAITLEFRAGVCAGVVREVNAS